MKKILILGCSICFVLLVSCKSGKKENGDSKTMSIAAAKSFTTDEANIGKEITVEGYVWSINDMADGGKAIVLGDEMLTGMKQATFVCKFSKEKISYADGAVKDAIVVASGNIGKGTGGIEMTNCKILAVKE